MLPLNHPAHDGFLVGLGSAANDVIGRDWLTRQTALLVPVGKILDIVPLFEDVCLPFLLNLHGICSLFLPVPDDSLFLLVSGAKLRCSQVRLRHLSWGIVKASQHIMEGHRTCRNESIHAKVVLN